MNRIVSCALLSLCPLLPFRLQAQDGTHVQNMPAELEVRFALSALPSAMRSAATVYRLDVERGYQKAHEGTSGIECLVQRTGWEQSDFRDDIYVPRCYDAAGARTYLRVLMDAAALRARGATPAALKAQVETRYRTGRYKAPSRAGLSYMIAPVMRTWIPDRTVHTMSGPHVMFYAPNVTDASIGALPAVSQAYPFLVREGVGTQSFMIQLVGASERAQIIADERQLLDDLCAYRNVLCLAPHGTP